MRWEYEKEPEIGAERVIKRFAWLPEQLCDGYKVWLESYYVQQRYASALFGSGTWVDTQTWSQEKHKTDQS